METKHTPGPWSVTVRAQFPFDIVITGLEPIVTLNRWGYSSEAKTVEDVMLGVGFPYKQRPEIAGANARQMANASLIAAAPELYAALKGMMTGPENKTHLKWEAAKAALAKAEGSKP